MPQLSALCDRYRLYATVIISIRRLLPLYDSYQLYATVIFTIKQVSALCDSYVSYPTSIGSIRQISVLSVIRQLLAVTKKLSSMFYWSTIGLCCSRRF